MPVLEFQCCGEVEEVFRRPSESRAERPICPECGHKMTQVHTKAPGVIWARPLSFYNDKKLEGAAADGHWVERVRSNRNNDGSPDREYITTRQAQLRFIKDEGLVDPADVSKIEATSDGLRSGSNK